MKFTRPNTILFAFMAMLNFGSSSSLAQGSNEYAQALRELDIMSNIFDATSDQRRNNSNAESGFDFDEAIYLADQGMLFSFRIRSGRNIFRDLNISAAMPVEAIIEISNDIQFEFGDMQREMFFLGNDDFGGFSETEIEEMEEMSDMMRDRQRNIRDLQRDMRDLQRQLRNPEDGNAEVEAQIAALESQIETETSQLNQQSANYRQFMEEFSQARNQKIALRNQSVVQEIMTTLCDYGATLRSLQNGEHVTIVLQNFNDNLDQVYVFDFNDVAACSSGDNLLQTALAYQL